MERELFWLLHQACNFATFRNFGNFATKWPSLSPTNITSTQLAHHSPLAIATALLTAAILLGGPHGTAGFVIRAAVFQAPAPQSNEAANPLAILTQVADSLRVAAMHGVDVVLYPELYLSGGLERGLDREGYELNIVGNVCGELNVACAMGYLEKAHESELKGDDASDGQEGAYNSIAAFHADGSRAANYRSVSKSTVDGVEIRVGDAFVEAIPTVLQLPKRSAQDGERELRVGMICGSDMLHPEITSHLVNNGAQAIFASASFRNNAMDMALMECVAPTRALENDVPLLLANFVGQDFVGSSAIISQSSASLVCGPKEEDGDLPCDRGYLLPCEVGALYAADVDISPGMAFQSSGDQWDLSPRIPDAFTNEGRQARGFSHTDRQRQTGKSKRTRKRR